MVERALRTAGAARAATVFLAASAALAGPAAKSAATQTRSQPTLVLTIFGGAVTGHSLWRVDKQPLGVLGTENTTTPEYDTLQLGRSISTSIVVGLSATYYRGAHLGVHADIAYVGLPFDDSCSGLYYYYDGENRNKQVCDNIGAASGGGGAMSVAVGASLRAAPRGSVSPYVRAGIGIVNETRSTIDMAGVFVSGTSVFVRQVIIDPSPKRTTVSLTAAVGLAAPLGPGYQVRVEMRDVVVSLERLTGPADRLAIGPVASRRYHHLALTMGLDVVLEHRRGRRY